MEAKSQGWLAITIILHKKHYYTFISVYLKWDPDGWSTQSKFFYDSGYYAYHQVSDISRTLFGNKIVDHSDVACWRCSNYIFILDLTPGFIGLGTGNCQDETRNI